VTTKQKIGHTVGIVCVALQAAAAIIEISHWHPIADWWYVDFAATLLAVAGSLYAALNAKRSWYAIFAIESFGAFTMFLTWLDVRR